jgi:adenylate cyclase, class 2
VIRIYSFAMADEVEIKFKIADLGDLEQNLKKAGFRLQTPRTHEMNTLYDFSGDKLRRKGELIRLRQYGCKWVLTHKAKAKAGRHKTRAETETTVEKGEAMAAILESLGLKPRFRYEKFRAEWSDGSGHVVVDETPVGNLGEIEGPAAWIDQTASKLGIGEEQYLTLSYAELFLEWKRRTRSSAQEMTFAAVKSGDKQSGA